MFEELEKLDEGKEITEERVEKKDKASVNLFFGDTASGKTFTAFSFPEPIFVIDTESRDERTKRYYYDNKKIVIFEPVVLKTEFDDYDNDALDTYKTIENISKKVIWYYKNVKEGNIKGGTLILDSATDFWSFCQDWGIQELSKRRDRQGIKKADTTMMTVEQQTDWKIINKKHHEIIGVLRHLINEGIFVVFTARESRIPDWVKNKSLSTKDKIRCQLDLPFLCDNIFNLMRQDDGNEVKFYAKCIKLSSLPTPDGYIEKLTFDKIQKLIKQQEEKLK